MRPAAHRAHRPTLGPAVKGRHLLPSSHRINRASRELCRRGDNSANQTRRRNLRRDYQAPSEPRRPEESAQTIPAQPSPGAAQSDKPAEDGSGHWPNGPAHRQILRLPSRPVSKSPRPRHERSLPPMPNHHRPTPANRLRRGNHPRIHRRPTYHPKVRHQPGELPPSSAGASMDP